MLAEIRSIDKLKKIAVEAVTKYTDQTEINRKLQRRCRLMEIALGRIANEPPENAKRIAENVMKEVDGGKD